MTEWLKNLFVAIFGANSPLATLIISMIPIVELRGAIPFGAATALWGDHALEVWQSFLFAVLGSSLVCVILTFLFWPIFKWLKNTKMFKKLATTIENKLNRSSKSISDKAQSEANEKKIRKIKWLGVFAFVAIPLPLTGVWTGTCIALFIGMSKKDTMLSVILGNLVAGTIMMIISYFFADNTMIVLLAFLAIVVVFILFLAIRALVKKIKSKKQNTEVLELSNSLETEADIEVLETEDQVAENQNDVDAQNIANDDGANENVSESVSQDNSEENLDVIKNEK